jgi:hypothetical protein
MSGGLRHLAQRHAGAMPREHANHLQATHEGIDLVAVAALGRLYGFRGNRIGFEDRLPAQMSTPNRLMRTHVRNMKVAQARNQGNRYARRPRGISASIETARIAPKALANSDFSV